MPDQEPVPTPEANGAQRPAPARARREATADRGAYDWSAGSDPLGGANGSPPPELPARPAPAAKPVVRQLESAPAPEAPDRWDEPTEQPVRHLHPERLVEAAEDAGFTSDQIAAFTTEELRAVVRAENRRAHQELRELRRQDNFAERGPVPTRQAAAGPPAGAAPVPPAGAAPPAAAVGRTDDPIGWAALAGLDLEDDVAAALRTAFQSFTDEISSLKSQLAAVEPAVRQVAETENRRRMGDVERQIEDWFAALKSPGVFGEGTARQLGLDSAFFAKRKAVLQEADRVFEASRRALPYEQCMKKAAATLFGVTGQPQKPAKSGPARQANGRFAAPAGDEFDDEVDRWRGSGLARPSGRGAEEPVAGADRAMRNLGRRMTDAGIEDGDGGVSLDDFLD